ncbi:hypothetical protein M3Y99_01114900 [Aphelenchoides fujianensis]|nr:hypothetical protein M3Y99_01114900 [Aphelenchoides fujianensis]
MEPEKADSTPRAHRLTPRTSRGRKSTNSEPPRPSSPSPSPPAGREIRLLRVRLEELRLRLGTAADEKENRAPTPERLARLREEQRARRRAEDECAALRARDAAPQTLERLAEDNRALYRKLIDARRQVQEQRRAFGCRRPPKPAVRFGAVERISADGRVDRRALPDRELGVLRRELEAERQQRRDVTRLLLQMSRDLKTLFHKQEE